MKDLVTDIADVPVVDWHIPHLPQVKIPDFQLHTPGAPKRDSIESYIKNRFWDAHRAQVSHFLPNIISLCCSDAYSAAVGLAPAVNGSLFAETYLAEPVEQVIANKLGVSIDRERVIEIGNLVSTWKGSSLLLFIFIGELIERLGYHWVLFTATREVQRLLARLHYSPIILADADPQVLPDAGASWGSYYANQPRVMCGDVRPAIAAARKNPMYRATLMVINRQIDRICIEYRQGNSLVDGQGGEAHE